MSPERLMEIIWKLWNAEELRPRDGLTFCNVAVFRAARRFGCTTLDGKTANQIYDELKTPGRWEKVGPMTAQRCANDGWLVVAAQKGTPHGHVAIVVPGAFEFSTKWKTDAPKVMQIGAEYWIGKKASWAFPTPPEYFALVPSDEDVETTEEKGA